MALKIYFEDEAKVITDTASFFQSYSLITAAGGVVLNDEGKILFIFRRGKWDLPKGKKEDDESLETCAKREVMEETGLARLELQRFLLTTYHTYRYEGSSVAKDTHWFLFRAPGQQPVSPQTDEDIASIEWADPADLSRYTANTYQLIIDVLNVLRS